MAPFVLCSYNVLADSYVKPSYFPLVAPALLQPAPRQAALCAQLRALNADVYCLQEVEPPAFAAFAATLEPLGYVGHFAPKGAGRPDGCALFVRQAVLTVHAVTRVAYRDGQGAPDSGHVAQVLTATLLAPPHPAQEPRQAATTLVIVNSHLRWTPAGGDRAVKQRQVALLLEAALAAPAAARVLCGDFNLVPTDELLAPLHAAGLRSIWADEVQSTCCANGQVKCVDHVFYSQGLQAQVERLPLLTPQRPIPAPGQPSDHLPLRVALQGLPAEALPRQDAG